MDETALQRALEAIRAYWLEPELRRRIEAGRLPDDFTLQAFQVVTDETGAVREVRLNDEVRAAVRWRSRRERAMDDITLGDRTIDVPEILLTDDDPNAAHITGIKVGDGWTYSWDFRLNARVAAEHGMAGKEFLDSAAASLAAHNMRPFVQNLLDATELMAKAYLVTTGYQPGRTHQAVSREFKSRAKDREGASRLHAALERVGRDATVSEISRVRLHS